MGDIKIGVVGAGYWGPNLIRNCFELQALDGVCDIDEVALQSVRERYPTVFTSTSFDELLERPLAAVIIAAPAQYHAAMCLKAISAGKHVFVEKPLALTVEEGRQIAAAAKAAGLLVFVGHVLLYHPAIIKLRLLVASGAIGDVWHLRSRRLSLGKLRTYESVWWSFAPHDVAIMLAVMGEEPLSAVAAQTCARNEGISDVAYADFEFSRGKSAHIEVNWLDPEKVARLDVFGTRGVLTLTDSRNGSTLTHKPTAISQDERGLPVTSRGEERNIEVEPGEPLRAEIQAFIDSIRNNASAETDVNQGIAVLRALEMADEALRAQSSLRAFA